MEFFRFCFLRVAIKGNFSRCGICPPYIGTDLFQQTVLPVCVFNLDRSGALGSSTQIAIGGT